MPDEKQTSANEPTLREAPSSSSAEASSQDSAPGESAKASDVQANDPVMADGELASDGLASERSPAPSPVPSNVPPPPSSPPTPTSPSETDQSPGEPEAARTANPSAHPRSGRPNRGQPEDIISNKTRKPALVPTQSNKLAMPQGLKRTGSVAKVAGSKFLRDTGEGLVGFSEWLDGKTNDNDLAEAAAVQENLEERFEGSWQKWGGFLDKLKSPLPKKIRRISNSRLTGFLVGILVFLFLALSSAISGTSSQAKDADMPLTRRPPSPPSGKLVKSRGSETASNPSSGAKTEKKTSQSKTQASSQGNSKASASTQPPTGQSPRKKSVSAADFFGESSPRQAPPLNRSTSQNLSQNPSQNPSPAPRPATSSSALPHTPGNPSPSGTPAPAANPPTSPYPYANYGVPGYPPPGYGQPPNGVAGGEAPSPGYYPPPYPYPPYFYPPAGYPLSGSGSGQAAIPDQPGPDGQPSPYGGGYAPYPYPYPYPPPAAVPSQPAAGLEAPGTTATPGDFSQSAKTPVPATAPTSATVAPNPASPSEAVKSLPSDLPTKK